ncbi:hypothetical protein O6H91_07G039600 [Diphasiastrum complanatum]|uniref:Uncharacterized protein n=1 Tax=Diphasiastrum complanatum TaxID=34168 RepID=A0ACC2D4D4_DIPCM|nr:hypothetical protein O6H91_07G039600 [Diphasiastrum complanatum]
MALPIQKTVSEEDPGVKLHAVKKGVWKAVQSTLKHGLNKLSPIACLSRTRDFYVDSMTEISEHIGEEASIVQGIYMASPLQYSPCREVLRRDEEDRLFYVALALCKQQSELNPSYGAGPIFVTEK